jgi:anti-sigma regulatory factor (Ser/Thr protein kinase)
MNLRKYVIVDFGSVSEISEDIIIKISELLQEFSTKFLIKLCFVAQNEETLKKIKLACDDNFLKYFCNAGDAINYFYWDCCKERDIVNMKMPSNIGLVPSVRACINDFVTLCNVTRKEAFQVELIIDELCNNAIEHGTQDENKTIEVLCSVNDVQIEISVYNGYSPRTAKEKAGHEIEKNMEKWAKSPNQTEDDFRGRGLGLVKKFSDSFEINSSGDGTWVHVIKNKEGEYYANAN